MPDERKHWFPAKRTGLGWGLPACWQGWAVLIIFFALLIFGTSILPPGRYLVGYIAVLSGLLLGVGFLKGEPLRWRNHGDG